MDKILQGLCENGPQELKPGQCVAPRESSGRVGVERAFRARYKESKRGVEPLLKEKKKNRESLTVRVKYEKRKNAYKHTVLYISNWGRARLPCP